jgi:hypothetical protein
MFSNGAVCGALLGCRLGFSQLPKDWLAVMPHKKWLDKKVVQFIHLLFPNIKFNNQQ